MDERLTLADDAGIICEEVVTRYFIPETRYQRGKVPTLVSSMADLIVQRLTQESKLPRKYIALITIVQKNGAGLASVASCSWDTGSDACYVYQAENREMHCIITVFGVTM